MAEQFAYIAVIEWDALRTRFLKEMSGIHEQNRYSGEAMRSLANYNRDSEQEQRQWLGATIEDVYGWLRNGYNPPEFAAAAAYVQPAMHGDWVYDEEGENVDVGAALSGDDAPFVDWQDTPSRPGLKVSIELAFRYNTPAKVIAEYGAWVAGMLANFESQGIDLEVDVETPTQASLLPASPGASTQTIIRIKRAREIRPFSDWSVLFSPPGFRTLGFMARAMSCEQWQTWCSPNFGLSLQHDRWAIEYEPEARSLRVRRPATARTFAAATLTAQLRAHGLA